MPELGLDVPAVGLKSLPSYPPLDPRLGQSRPTMCFCKQSSTDTQPRPIRLHVACGYFHTDAGLRCCSRDEVAQAENIYFLQKRSQPLHLQRKSREPSAKVGPIEMSKFSPVPRRCSGLCPGRQGRGRGPLALRGGRGQAYQIEPVSLKLQLFFTASNLCR